MRYLIFRAAFLASLLVLVLASPVTMSVARAQSSQAPASDGSEYHLGPGDKVRITVFGEDSLTGEFSVSGAGKLSIPLIGEIDAANLTIAQLQGRVESALRDGYLKDPRVSAEVLTYRPFYILGEVNKPGEYPYTSGQTVLSAVATAEGFTYRANTKFVFIHHGSETQERRVPLTSTTPVAPGDTIRVGERFF